MPDASNFIPAADLIPSFPQHFARTTITVTHIANYVKRGRTFNAAIRPSIPSNLADMCVYAVAVAAVAAAAAAAAVAPPPAPDRDPLPLMLLCLWTIFLLTFRRASRQADVH